MISKKIDTDRDIYQALSRETVSVFAPIVRIYLIFVSLYYVVVTINHLTSEVGYQLYFMTCLSVVSSIVAMLFGRNLKGDISFIRLEISGLVGNALLLMNLIYFYITQFDQDRLVYFILMVFLFALTGSSRRVATVSVIAALTALYAVLISYEPSLLQNYIYIGVASCIAALGTSLMLRRVITDALNAKLEAARRKSEAVEAAEHATMLSVTDNLTGLPNRRDFFQALKDRAKHHAKSRSILAILLIDLDAFKPVNDNYGHKVGDTLLIAVGQRLQMHLPDDCYLARIGGDEFAVIAPVETIEEAQKLGNHLCECMRAPYNLGRVVVHMSATVGIAVRKAIRTSPHKLLERADFALFNAKRRCKGSSAIFTLEDATKMNRMFKVDQALRSCDLDKELEVVYQPQVNLATQRVTGFEALARWHSRKLGQVDPATFIAVAEASGLIVQVTQVLLRKTMQSMADWPTDLTVSFNLSAHDILDTSAIDEVLRIAGETSVDPARICFEITETVMMSDSEKASQTLQKIVDAGHQVALDDFGTGYSNFNYLLQLPITKIKIDRTFLRNASVDKKSAQMISALLQLARSLKKDCIVEGVETELDLVAMKGLGARVGQGFYWGKPMEAAKALKLVHDNGRAKNEPESLTA